MENKSDRFYREYPGSKAEIRYITDPKQSYREFVEFISALKEENISHKYPQTRQLEDFDPDNPTRFHGVEKTLRAYVAEEDAKKIAIALGEENDKNFELDWLFVRPEFRNGVATEKIFEILFAKYNSIKLLASAQFGYEPKLDESQIDKNRAIRQISLIEYYKKLGFKENTESESYQYSDVPGNPMPMIWRRQ